MRLRWWVFVLVVVWLTGAAWATRELILMILPAQVRAGDGVRGTELKTERKREAGVCEGRRSLSMLMAEGIDLAELRRHERARYLEFALIAARDERRGFYTTAAEAWGEALKTARGVDVDWCQSRLALCLLYARLPVLPHAVADRVTGSV